MLNIISNAVKFTKSGLIKIQCSIMTVKQAVIVSIIDTGIGIPDNKKEKLFNDFQMISDETVDNSMGSGLGLSICKSLASSMKIELSTTSTYGTGSEFSLAIPFLPDCALNTLHLHSYLNENQIEEECLSETNYKETSRHIERLLPYEQSYHKGIDSKNKFLKIELKDSSRTVRSGIDECMNPDIMHLGLNLKNNLRSPSMSHCSQINYNDSAKDNEPNRNNTIEIKEEKRAKILIVDDNHYNSESTKIILKKVLKEAGSNIEILIGTDGADIIHQIIKDQFKRNEIKCIITDENMEYINGSEAIRIIRDLERRHKTKFVNIISVTGNVESESINEIIKAGAQLVLSKPLPRTMITKALKDLNII